MQPTDTDNPEYFHKVIDCQFACPAHTPVPEYIRLISEKRFDEAYRLNWESNVFPGVLGRVCDRPCEPACRRGRVEREPVAICRLKRFCADHRDPDLAFVPPVPAQKQKNGKRIALIGGGPASLTVARDLLPLGYTVDLYDDQARGGGFMRSQLPSFRLPESVLMGEVQTILDMGVHAHFNHRVESLKALLAEDYDAVFVGTGAPRGRDLPDLPGRREGDPWIHVGIDWLAGVVFRHVASIGRRVLVLGGGNTAMDCCRTARRLGGEEVRVVVRSPRAEMKASPWEIEEAEAEDIPILDNHVPQAFVIEDGRLAGMRFNRVRAVYEDGRRRLVPTGEASVFLACDEVLLAVGQVNAFPWIEADAGIAFTPQGLPVLDPLSLQSTVAQVFFGGDAAFGPRNIITAVAHGHEAAISIDLFCRGRSLHERPAPQVDLAGQKMGVHDWLYDNRVVETGRQAVATVAKHKTLRDRLLEVELGFDREVGQAEAARCLNCDVQTVFHAAECIECDACADACPESCISFVENGTEEELRTRLRAPARNLGQSLYVSAPLGTGRVMVKDENLCLHCGVCSERCPTSAWEMQKFLYHSAQAGQV